MHDGICWAQMCPPNRRRNGTAESHVDTGDEQPLDWDTACVHVHLACAVFDEIRSQWQLHGDVTECGACGQMSVQVLVVSGEHLAGPGSVCRFWVTQACHEGLIPNFQTWFSTHAVQVLNMRFLNR